MVRRSHRRRKRFNCGHSGFGQFCHRCRPVMPGTPVVSDEIIVTSSRSQPHRGNRKTDEQRIATQQWQNRFAHDPINLTHLPKPIVLRTRRILASLNQGILPGELKGRRFNFDRTLLRIPVGYRYRLLCRWYGDRIVPLQVLTHEAYNAVARNKKRLRG